MSSRIGYLSFSLKETPMFKPLLLASLALVFAAPSTGLAGTVSWSATDPTVNDADIAQLTSPFTQDSDSRTSFENKPHQGQTFITGSNATGYDLVSLSLVSGAWNGNAFTSLLDIGTIDGSNNITSILGSAESFTSNHVVGEWATFTLASPVHLDPSTLYGIEINSRTPNGGSFGFQLKGTTDGSSPYADGQAYSRGQNLALNPITLRNFDRAFHLDMTATSVPEPSSMVLAGLGLIGLAGWGVRRRRAR